MNEPAMQLFEGSWSGDVDLAGTPVPIVLHVATVDATLRITADFPRHYRTGVALLDASADGHVLRFATRNMGVFEGRLAADGRRIDGAFANGEQRYPLVLRSGATESADPPRPQAPKPPYPYDVEQVRVDNTSAGCRLAGTLTIPQTPVRAATLLITGSGAMDRDETVFGHKPFLVLADHLSRHGYATLRLDNRGVGESTGDRAAHVLDDDLDDMSAAVAFLRRRLELRDVPIGLIGHSVGALTGMRLAARDGDIAFLVSMAGPGLSVGEAFAGRECDLLDKAGTAAAAVERHRAFTLALYRNLRERNDAPIDSAQITALAGQFEASATAVVKDSADWIARFNEPWFRSLVRFEPLPILRQVSAPFLAINGSLDTQVRATANLGAMRQALEQAAARDFSLIELPGLNHLFQTCTTGAPYEYPAIEETFAPVALETIRAWLDARVAARAQRA